MKQTIIKDDFPEKPLVSVVVIGRNEGNRLVRCLESVNSMESNEFSFEVIYVDSASTDGSQQRATALGAKLVQVNPDRPSAALARNAGWREAKGEFILFLDGDTQLHSAFVSNALKEMENANVVIVWGHRRESNPKQSIYVQALDLDWIYAPGLTIFCGGDALMRRKTLETVGGFDSTLIAGEEPELCRRIRALGFTILHIDKPMTLHDLAITHFSSYWKRAFRAGHAYAEIASRFANSNDPLWQKEARRNIIHGTAITTLPFVLLLSLSWPWITIGILLFFSVVFARTLSRCAWKTPVLSTRVIYTIHSHFQQIPILFGQISFTIKKYTGKSQKLIEYNH